jgi:hypothetical protein
MLKWLLFLEILLAPILPHHFFEDALYLGTDPFTAE